MADQQDNPFDTPPPPPNGGGAPAGQHPKWFARKIWKLPTWAWIAIGAVVLIGVAGQGGSEQAATDTTEASQDAPDESDTAGDAPVEPAEEEVEETTTTVAATTTTTQPATTTTTEPPLPIIESGTYIVGQEIAPGAYRVSGYFARLDSNFDIIDNDGVYDEGSFTYVEVLATDAYLEISGEAISVEAFREALGGNGYDPLRAGAISGTYIVGEDIQPGRYRVTDSSYAYAARLSCDRDIIDNAGNEGSVILEVRAGDCLFEFSGELSKID